MVPNTNGIKTSLFKTSKNGVNGVQISAKQT